MYCSDFGPVGPVYIHKAANLTLHITFFCDTRKRVSLTCAYPMKRNVQSSSCAYGKKIGTTHHYILSLCTTYYYLQQWVYTQNGLKRKGLDQWLAFLGPLAADRRCHEVRETVLGFCTAF